MNPGAAKNEAAGRLPGTGCAAYGPALMEMVETTLALIVMLVVVAAAALLLWAGYR